MRRKPALFMSAPPKPLSESERETLLNQNVVTVSPLQHSDGIASRGGRSADEINKELSSGKVLSSDSTNNQETVVDFASVKDHTSKAERALSRAREEYMKGDSNSVSTSGNLLMGINADVIKAVGHDLGTFIENDNDIQGCASWVRSRGQGANGVFSESSVYDIRTFTAEEEARFQTILAKAYEESGEVTEAFAKTFYLGTQLMGKEAKEAIWAIYVWCRRTDEIVDAPRDSNEEMLLDLSVWETRLERLWEHGEVIDVLDLPLLDVRIKYPNLPIQPFLDMVRGMLMDIPDLGQDRYDSFEELHLYCYRVAGTVGLMSMPIFGCAPGFTDEEAKEPALSLGVAFQLTNILRDVGEDAGRGRIYLPKEDMERFNVTEEQIFNKRMDENYAHLMKYEIARARRYYERAGRGVAMLSADSRLPVQSSLDCYGKILDKIELNQFDTLNYRAYVGKWEKLFIIPFSWYRTQDIAKVLPLLGDDTK